MKEKPNRYREEELEEKVEETPDNVNEKEKIEEVETKLEDKEEIVEEKKEDELAKLTNSYLRLMADFDNFKKRTNEERIRERKYAYQSLFEKMINVIDIFDKAVNMQTDDEKLKNFLIGFKMINDNLNQILADEGVKKIDTKDQMFNPSFHHAMDVDWDENKPENAILTEIQTGYMYKDKLLRPSLVKVNQKSKGNENNE